LTAVVVGVGLLVAVPVLTLTGHWDLSWATVPVCLFLVCFTVTWWWTARVGVYVGPSGARLYRAFWRVDVVPWDEVVHFEARPLWLPTFAEVGAVVHLVVRSGDARPTVLKLSCGTRYDLAAYSGPYDVVMPAEEFHSAVDTLDLAVHPTTRPR
jgi:hypothetical protein